MKDAADAYMEWFKAHRKSARETRYTIDTHILPALGKVEVERLTAKRLRAWHEGLAKAPARLRTRPGQDQRYRHAADDPEAPRRRRATANRVITVLKALLNHAWQEGRVASDDAWRRVKPFRQADAARVRHLTAAECKRLVNACDQEFRPLVRAALYTGCRYGELCRLSASDFNPDAGTVTVREAKAGKPRHVALSDEGRKFFEAATAGRASDAPIFPRLDGNRWGRAHQTRPLRDACERAKITPAVSFHILRHTYASHLVMNGAPIQVVAHNLGHSDTRMVEKHYAHLQPSYIADAIRAAAPRLGIGGKGNVVRMGTTK